MSIKIGTHTFLTGCEISKRVLLCGLGVNLLVTTNFANMRKDRNTDKNNDADNNNSNNNDNNHYR